MFSSLCRVMSPSLRRVMSPSLRGVISSIFLTEGQERGLVSRITLIPLLMLVLKRPKIFAWKKFAFALLLSFSPSGRSYNCPSDFLPDQAILRNLSALCVSKGKTKTKIRVAWVGMAKSLRCTSPRSKRVGGFFLAMSSEARFVTPNVVIFVCKMYAVLVDRQR